jgi:pheromone shutdown-related protein TraB
MSEPVAEGEGRVRLVGTAHVSAQSVEEVRAAIAAERPDVVAVELDEARYRQLKGQTPEDLDPADLLRGNTVFQFLAYWLLSYVQTRLGERFDIEPGADMKAAVEAAEERGVGVALVDREIQTTIQRFWKRLSLVQKVKLVGQLTLAMAGIGVGDVEEEFTVEDLTDTDVVTAMLEEFRRFSPRGAEALIDERDAYIAHKLVGLRASGRNVVAVVGAGHVEGIERYLERPETLPPIETLTGRASGRRFSVLKVGSYLFMVGFLAFFGLLALAGVSRPFLVRLFVAWFLFNGAFAFGMAKLAGARWSSATVGGLVAWLTSINPLLAPGWFAGYVELRHNPVSVSDIGTLNELLSDTESSIRSILGRMVDVPLFRLMMVIAATNVGSIIASALFFVVVVPWLGQDVGGVDAILAQLFEGARIGADVLLGWF